jgi:hypothetical protein
MALSPVVAAGTPAGDARDRAHPIIVEEPMRRTAVLVWILLLLTVSVSWAQGDPPTVFSPQPTPTIAATPTPESVELPKPMGGWWKAAQQLAARYGWWVAVGAILLLVPLYFLWKVGEEVAEEEAKNVAARVRRGA